MRFCFFNGQGKSGLIQSLFIFPCLYNLSFPILVYYFFPLLLLFTGTKYYGWKKLCSPSFHQHVIHYLVTLVGLVFFQLFHRYIVSDHYESLSFPSRLQAEYTVLMETREQSWHYKSMQCLWFWIKLCLYCFFLKAVFSIVVPDCLGRHSVVVLSISKGFLDFKQKSMFLLYWGVFTLQSVEPHWCIHQLLME